MKEKFLLRNVYNEKMKGIVPQKYCNTKKAKKQLLFQ
jgi:hypothetical protein